MSAIFRVRALDSNWPICLFLETEIMKTLIWLIGLAALLTSATAPSAPVTMHNTIGTLDVRNLCAAVSEQTLELEPIHDYIVYRYQNMLARAAGVKPSDSEEILYRKTGAFIDANMPKLLCNQFNFNPANGNILKLAIARSSEPFIDNAINDWKVQLNQIDKVDDATVLDYILRRKVEAGSNANLVKIYDNYERKFRTAGALTAAELRKSKNLKI